MTKAVVTLLIIAFTVASVFAIWPVVADAPWETDTIQPISTEETNLPASSKLQVENAVRAALDPQCRDLVSTMDSEYLGEDTWEVAVRLIGYDGTEYALTYRVGDARPFLQVRPLNAPARNLCTK